MNLSEFLTSRLDLTYLASDRDQHSFPKLFLFNQPMFMT